MTTEAEKTTITGVRLVRPNERILAAAQTTGMIREEAVQTDHLWAGIARTKPGNISNWHHHGEWETIAYVIAGACRLEFGLGGRGVVVAEPGDYIYIPKGEIHRESNPTEGEQALVIVRFGTGPVVINVDGPAAEGELSETELDTVAGGGGSLANPADRLLVDTIKGEASSGGQAWDGGGSSSSLGSQARGLIDTKKA